MIYLDIRETDPRRNLALEEHLFRTVGQTDDCFLLWQNRSSVIVGRHQNTLAETNGAFLREHGIPAVRRLSGGGAVYHDLGNLNFTFITARERMEAMRFELFCTPVVETLRELGVDAQLSGRNDLSVDGRKFSGNSQYTSGGRLLHHGTILFAADLETMTAALTPPYEKLQSKGTPSVRGRVVNLSEALVGRVSLEEFRRLLANRALRGRTCSRFSLTADDWAAVDKLAREKYGSWEWNYGDSPPCSFSVKAYWNGCGTVEARVLLREGRIETVKFYGDFFGEESPAALEDALCGQKPEPAALEHVWNSIPVTRYLHGVRREDFVRLFDGARESA